MKIGVVNHPVRNPLAEIEWIGKNGFDFVDFTLEPPAGLAELRVMNDNALAGDRRVQLADINELGRDVVFRDATAMSLIGGEIQCDGEPRFDVFRDVIGSGYEWRSGPFVVSLDSSHLS
jgi:hypothetical protein